MTAGPYELAIEAITATLDGDDDTAGRAIAELTRIEEFASVFVDQIAKAQPDVADEFRRSSVAALLVAVAVWLAETLDRERPGAAAESLRAFALDAARQSGDRP